ncbi:MAG TPA: response regulator [Woeseiaceae bacterium]|nr:response regulator [Woeseiaceae bacterium]
MILSRQQPLKILVVDDDELDRLAVRRCLQQSTLDVRPHQAASAAAAIEEAAGGDYDCILLDYYLPGEDSMAALRELQQAAPRTPVVIFTGRGDEHIAVELMKTGAADYLPKGSLTPERLETAIRHALRVWEDAEARRRAERLLRLLSEAAQHLLKAADPQELVQGLRELVAEPLGADACFTITIGRAGAPPRLTALAGLPEDAVASLLAAGETGCLATDEPLQLAGIRQADDTETASLRAAGIRTCACYPLQADDQRFGTLCFASRGKDAFAPDEQDFLGTLAHYATSALQRLRHIEAMRESDRRKDEFLAVLAHELRDPLAPLANGLELIKHSHGDARVLHMVKETMERQLGQLVQLVDDLLDVARITRGQLQLHLKRVELAAALHQATEMVAPLIETAGLSLEVSAPDEPVWLEADPVRLVQVFGNLLINASKFTERGGRIVLGAERQDGSVVVTVSDTGVGIPPDQLRSIFDLFAQVPNGEAQSPTGLGIGLTLVARLVAMHGGTVQASSDGPGKGSRFVVRLPATADGEADAAPPEEAEEPADGGGHRILVVDDNHDSAASLAMLLQMSGNTVHEAYDGPEAIDAAREFRPEVLLLDIGLPTLDGYEVCRRIRKEAWGRDILVIALSGWGQPEDRRKSKEAGFDHHMVKPVKHGELTELLNRRQPARTPGRP